MADFFKALGDALAEHEEKFIFGPDMEFPVEIKGVRVRNFIPRHDMGTKPGMFVAIRPVDDEKTYLGLYLGDLRSEILYQLEKKTGILYIVPIGNPGIFVFDLNQLVYGYESWWGQIKDENHLKQITNETINNLWYVKALKQIQEREQNEKE